MIKYAILMLGIFGFAHATIDLPQDTLKIDKNDIEDDLTFARLKAYVEHGKIAVGKSSQLTYDLELLLQEYSRVLKQPANVYANRSSESSLYTLVCLLALWVPYAVSNAPGFAIDNKKSLLIAIIFWVLGVTVTGKTVSAGLDYVENERAKLEWQKLYYIRCQELLNVAYKIELTTP